MSIRIHTCETFLAVFEIAIGHLAVGLSRARALEAQQVVFCPVLCYTFDIMLTPQSRKYGFTIVELLIVIVVIAILATISIVAYNGIQKRATETTLKSDLSNASKQLIIAEVTTGSYPNPSLPADVKASGTNTFQYSSGGTTFCLSATSPSASGSSFYITNAGTITPGLCAGHSSTGSSVVANGSAIQSITSSSCPTTRTRAFDARDNNTYWVQQLADGRCWMLTNLAYAGGGMNTYGDVKVLVHSTATLPQFTQRRYVIHADSNPTSEPSSPSISTSGGGQYGYFYNWCAAMGGQETAACANATTPATDPTVSVCPAGWRLPNTSEFASLNTAVNGGSTTSDAGFLTNWLAMRNGGWFGGFVNQVTDGYYWSSSPDSAGFSFSLRIRAASVLTAYSNSKNSGFAVRCIAS